LLAVPNSIPAPTTTSNPTIFGQSMEVALPDPGEL